MYSITCKHDMHRYLYFTHTYDMTCREESRRNVVVGEKLVFGQWRRVRMREVRQREKRKERGHNSWEKLESVGLRSGE